MNEKPNNPPAFPFTYEDRTVSGVRNTVVAEGMTLRDYFAAAALQGILADWGDNAFNPKVFAARAFTVADSMLAEREKGQQ